jgi:hypothetical protein
MSIMNIYKNNIKYVIYKNNLIKKSANIIYYKLPFNIIKLFFEKKNININKLKLLYLFLLTLGPITYIRYIL